MRKIGLICNQNNLFFGLGRHLRDAGYDVDLLLMNHESREWPHFHPSADTFDLEYQGWTKTLSWGEGRVFSSHSPRAIERELAPYDFLFGCGSAPAYLARIGRPLDLFMPYGSDLWEMPFRAPSFTRHSMRSLYELPRMQRRGVRAAKAVMGDRSPIIEGPLRRLAYAGQRIFGVPPLIYTPLYCQSVMETKTEQSHWYPLVKAFRDRCDVLVFSLARHVWRNPTPYIWSKGNDKIIRALARVREQRPSLRVGLVTCEYGPDVEASRELCQELNLGGRVLWLPVSPRRELMVLLAMADLVCAELGHSWFIAGTMQEALAMAKPLLHRREDSEFATLYPALYPMIDIKTASDATDAILRFADSPEQMRAVGQGGREWLEEYGVRRAMDAVRQLLGAP
jgi:glycosyltransferase involved in cell wall biosynthesis